MTNRAQQWRAIEAEFSNSLRTHQVPGASLAVLCDDKVYLAVAGQLNTELGNPVRPESMFQIGSITKVFTASLLMQLCDQGRLDLDRPIADYLQGFSLADPQASAELSCRQLLNHSAGIDGDVFDDCGRGEDCLARYVDSCARLSQCYPVGRRFSYCNSGYIIAGRLIEVLSGASWDSVLKSRLLAPLAMHREAASLAEHLVGRSVAIGHDVSGQSSPLTTAYALPFVAGPAGSTLTMSARALLQFAKLHINNGLSEAGERLLSEQSAQMMQMSSMQLPGPVSLGQDQWGLGWALSDCKLGKVLGHDGNTDGQRAFLRVLPNHRTAVALLSNGGCGIDLAWEVLGKVFDVMFDTHLPSLPKYAPYTSGDLRVYTGRYLHSPGYIDVLVDDQQLVLRQVENAAAPDAMHCLTLQALDTHLFACQRPPNKTPAYFRFLDFDDDGQANSLFNAYRLHRCDRASTHSGWVN